ncbi:MAG: hypothetical protein RLZZ436_4286 [Planctomycetota bacterium]
MISSPNINDIIKLLTDCLPNSFNKAIPVCARSAFRRGWSGIGQGNCRCCRRRVQGKQAVFAAVIGGPHFLRMPWHWCGLWKANRAGLWRSRPAGQSAVPCAVVHAPRRCSSSVSEGGLPGSPFGNISVLQRPAMPDKKASKGQLQDLIQTSHCLRQIICEIVVAGFS